MSGFVLMFQGAGGMWHCPVAVCQALPQLPSVRRLRGLRGDAGARQHRAAHLRARGGDHAGAQSAQLAHLCGQEEGAAESWRAGSW